MSLELTTSEIELADKLIASLEKRSRQWKWCRWFMLVAGVALVVLAMYVSFLLDRACAKDFMGWLLEGGNLPPEILKAYVELRMASLWQATSVLVQAVVVGLMGAFISVTSLVNWNRHLRDALMAKVLRAKLKSECGYESQATVGATAERWAGLWESVSSLWRDLKSGKARTGELLLLILAGGFCLAGLASIATYLVAWLVPSLRASPDWIAASDEAVIYSYLTAGVLFVAATVWLLRRRLLARDLWKTVVGTPLFSKSGCVAAAKTFGVSLPFVAVLWLAVWSIGTWFLRAVPGEGEWFGIATVCAGAAVTLVTWLVAWRHIGRGQH